MFDLHLKGWRFFLFDKNNNTTFNTKYSKGTIIMPYTLNITLSAAEAFFDSNLYNNDWDVFSDNEKTNALREAQTAIEHNTGTPLQTVADNVNTDTNTVYDFNGFVYVQSLFMLENAERYRISSGALSIMNAAEGKSEQAQNFVTALPKTFLYPEALRYTGIIPQGVVFGRA